MNSSSQIKFKIYDGWGDYKIVWMMKYEAGKAWNGYMEKGNIVWEEVTEGMNTTELTPFLKIPGWGVDMSGLFDALAEVAPPKQQTDAEAELKATKYHLEDMRKLVFKKDE